MKALYMYIKYSLAYFHFEIAFKSPHMLICFSKLVHKIFVRVYKKNKTKVLLQKKLSYQFLLVVICKYYISS